MRTIALNADVGEGTPYDAGLIPLITSANIACGGHAGEERTMEAAARLAIDHGVVIGAHPGHEDREHFGRRELPITPDELRDLLERQVNRLHSVVRGLGGEIRYVKLHGALYHQAGREASLAGAVINFVNGFHIPLALLGQAGTALADAAAAGGVEFAREAFADRTYLPDGTLAPRSTVGAMLQDEAAVAEQAVRLAPDSDSLCLHGDDHHAVENARAVRRALADVAIAVRAFSA